jgi:hypothetical protein
VQTLQQLEARRQRLGGQQTMRGLGDERHAGEVEMAPVPDHQALAAVLGALPVQLDRVDKADLAARLELTQVLARQEAIPALRLDQRVELVGAERVDLAEQQHARHTTQALADQRPARARHVVEQAQGRARPAAGAGAWARLRRGHEHRA